jgi:hypothetical protein
VAAHTPIGFKRPIEADNNHDASSIVPHAEALPSLMLAATKAFAFNCDVAELDSLQISWTVADCGIGILLLRIPLHGQATA